MPHGSPKPENLNPKAGREGERGVGRVGAKDYVPLPFSKSVSALGMPQKISTSLEASCDALGAPAVQRTSGTSANTAGLTQGITEGSWVGLRT